MAAFITEADLAAALKSALQLAPDTVLEPWWGPLVTAAWAEAYSTIVSSLMGRGFSKAQIDQWDQGATYQRLIGLWRCLNQAAVNQPEMYSLTALQAVDVRANLVKENVTVGGLWVYPDSEVAQVSVGPYDAAEDLFGTPVDPEDPRLGEVVRG